MLSSACVVNWGRHVVSSGVCLTCSLDSAWHVVWVVYGHGVESAWHVKWDVPDMQQPRHADQALHGICVGLGSVWHADQQLNTHPGCLCEGCWLLHCTLKLFLSLVSSVKKARVEDAIGQACCAQLIPHLADPCVYI